MHTSWTIGRKLTAAFGVMAFLLATASIAWLVDSYRSKRSLEHTVAVGATVRAAAEIEAFVRGMDGNQKLILVAGLTGVVERSEAGHKGVQEAMREIPARLDLLKTGATTDQTRQAAEGIAAQIDAWKRHHEQILALVAKQEFDQALTVDLGDSYTTQKKILDQAESLKRLLTLEADANAAEARAAFLVATTIAVVVVIAAFLLGVAATVVIRGITKALAAAASELRASAQHVASASGQVAASSQSLSQGATEQAASLEETSASMEEMSSMTRQNAENSQDAARQVVETERLVTGANTALTDLVATMASIRDSSGQVTKIIKTIDEIAFQTNILALNAAVEAARAGDAGMGFAVVADEVRNLAQRSAQAAKDTAALIESSATTAASGGDKVDAVVTAMDAITASSSRVHNLVDEVSVASRQQAQGIDQVTQAIAQMEKVTQTTAATAEESAAASQELNSQAGTALDVVVRLEEMVHGDRGVAQAHVAAPARSAATAGPADPKVFRLVRGSVPAQRPSPQEQMPLDDTGTFGRF